MHFKLVGPCDYLKDMPLCMMHVYQFSQWILSEADMYTERFKYQYHKINYDTSLEYQPIPGILLLYCNRVI